MTGLISFVCLKISSGVNNEFSLLGKWFNLQKKWKGKNTVGILLNNIYLRYFTKYK